jgi:phospholipid transport system substrate-binding protein
MLLATTRKLNSESELNPMNRRTFLQAGTIGTVTFVAAPHAVAADPAVGLIERFYASLTNAMKRSDATSVADKARLLSGPVNATFDTAAMTRLAMGPQWSSIAAGQQGAIQQAFARFLVATYAKQIRNYAGETFEVSQTTENRRIGTLVRSKIIESSGSATSIDYIVTRGRAIDVYLNSSVSELASRRAEFESILASGGGAALLNSLNERASRLLAG